MHECTIRDMQEIDIDQVEKLYREMYKEQKSLGMVMDLQENGMVSLLAAQLKSRLHLLKVIDCNGTIKGFASAGIIKLQKKYYIKGQNFIGFINDIYIVPEYRQDGLASKLLSVVEKDLTELDVHYVELHVLEKNPAGRQFWEKTGYEDVIRVMYKFI